MKRLFIFFLLGCALKGFSQESVTDTLDNRIRLLFAENGSSAIQDKNQAAFNHLLVKIKAEYIGQFKKQHSTFIKRQLSKQWFVIDNKTANQLTKSNQFMVEQIETANEFWKYSPLLLNKRNRLGEANYNFQIQVTDTAAFKRLILSNGNFASIIKFSGAYNLFVIRANERFIEHTILPLEIVNFIDIRLNAPKEETVINDYDNSANSINLFFAKYPNINGDGLTVSVKENKFDEADIDFKNRIKVTGLESASSSSHASTMATLIGGAGNSFFTGKGVANASTLTSSDFAVLLPDGNSYAQNNITVQNHSYGVGIENFYAADAAAYDQSMIDNPTLLHVFSAGNSGLSKDSLAGSPYENINGFANITGSFKMAKNILTIGSIDSFFAVPELSSKGPAYDGRVKPDLVAYGNDGSSGASAITSGVVLAVQSAYKQNHNDSLPVNTLTKAVIINSADDVNKKGPDYFSGYGNVNAYKAVQDIISGNYFSGTITDGQTQTFTLNLPANARNLKITLVWTDPAAQANALTALVNDLDLELKVKQNFYQPWILNSAPNADSLTKIAVRGRDSLNVVEQVSLDNPSSGKFTISVVGHNVSTTTQDYIIAYRWDAEDDFYFTSPAAHDHFTSGGNSIFRWQSTYAKNTAGILEYSINGGTSWRSIDTVNLSDQYFKWTALNRFTTAIARMTINGKRYYSDTFNFSRQLNPRVGFNCADSVLITWNPTDGVTGYRVFVLGDKYLEPFSNTTDTSIILHTATSPFVAVTTVLQNDHEGVRSYAFDYTTQGTGCYINNFLADLTVTNTALLQLSLGTTYNVGSIQFQQLTLNGWQTIQTVSPVVSETNNYDANTLHSGTNVLRAIVTLKNGSTIITTEATIYYSGGKNKFVIYPNPVSRNSSFTIVTDNFYINTFMLFDVTGRKVLQQNFNTTKTEIPVRNLARGVYFAVIYTEGVKTYSGKIVVN